MDQLAHPRSLISVFAIHLLNSIILKLAPSEVSLFYLVSVPEKAGFGMILSVTLETGFVASMLIYIHVNLVKFIIFQLRWRVNYLKISHKLDGENC